VICTGKGIVNRGEGSKNTAMKATSDEDKLKAFITK
jgi:hypothetical protein